MDVGEKLLGQERKGKKTLVIGITLLNAISAGLEWGEGEKVYSIVGESNCQKKGRGWCSRYGGIEKRLHLAKNSP